MDTMATSSGKKSIHCYFHPLSVPPVVSVKLLKELPVEGTEPQRLRETEQPVKGHTITVK